MQFEVNNIIGHLSIISNLKVGDTISTVTQNLIRRESWYRTYQKYMYKEDRMKTISWIESVIERAIYILTYSDMDDTLYQQFVEKLINCISGLNELYLTYSDDRSVQERIRKIQATIEQKIHSKQNKDSSRLYRNIYHLSSNNLKRLEKTQSLDIPTSTSTSTSSPDQFLSQSYPNSSVKNLNYSTLLD